LQSRIDEIRALDAEVLAIAVDPVEKNREVVESNGLGFHVLSDPELAAIDAFGLRHVGGGLDGDIARPGVFIIDREGRIAWRDLTENWRIRVRPEEIVERLATVP
jgi:peroxiredoxin